MRAALLIRTAPGSGSPAGKGWKRPRSGAGWGATGFMSPGMIVAPSPAAAREGGAVDDAAGPSASATGLPRRASAAGPDAGPETAGEGPARRLRGSRRGLGA